MCNKHLNSSGDQVAGPCTGFGSPHKGHHSQRAHTSLKRLKSDEQGTWHACLTITCQWAEHVTRMLDDRLPMGRTWDTHAWRSPANGQDTRHAWLTIACQWAGHVARMPDDRLPMGRTRDTHACRSPATTAIVRRTLWAQVLGGRRREAFQGHLESIEEKPQPWSHSPGRPARLTAPRGAARIAAGALTTERQGIGDAKRKRAARNARVPLPSPPPPSLLPYRWERLSIPDLPHSPPWDTSHSVNKRRLKSEVPIADKGRPTTKATSVQQKCLFAVISCPSRRNEIGSLFVSKEQKKNVWLIT